MDNKNRGPRIIAEHRTEGVEWVVKWTYDPATDFHQVTYGQQSTQFDGRGYGHTQAAHHYGECIAHAGACAGLFDVEEPEGPGHTGGTRPAIQPGPEDGQFFDPVEPEA